jgi:hypothetical protein
MRYTAAGIAAPLLAALAIGGPFASAGRAAPASVQCATASPPAACALLDDLAAQLGPVAPLLGDPLAVLTSSAQGFAARSDQPAGVPSAEVVQVSAALRDQLAALPQPVEALVGATVLGGLTDTLDALVAQLGAPATGEQGSGTTSPTPANVAPTAPSSSSGSRTSASSSGGSVSTGSSSSSSPSSTSSASVPDVPVGDPLTLAPLALPDFGFDPAFTPAAVDVAAPTPAAAEAAAYEEMMDALPDQGHGPELAVVVVLSLLLLAGAGVAQVQANRHQIPD